MINDMQVAFAASFIEGSPYQISKAEKALT
jgi:hypothetical protein